MESKIDLKAEDENGKTAEQIAEDVKVSSQSEASCLLTNILSQEEEMAAFLKACASGKIPAKAPAAKVRSKYLGRSEENFFSKYSQYLKVREQREFREVIPLEGCGEGCAVPE